MHNISATAELRQKIKLLHLLSEYGTQVFTNALVAAQNLFKINADMNENSMDFTKF